MVLLIMYFMYNVSSMSLSLSFFMCKMEIIIPTYLTYIIMLMRAANGSVV